MRMGIQEVIIVDTILSESRAKATPCVVVVATTQPEGEVVEIPIYFSEKSINMAHKQLKICGFDTDTTSLTKIAENPSILRGNRININTRTEMYNNKQQIRHEIVLNTMLPKEKVAGLDAMFAARQKAPVSEAAVPGTVLPTDEKDIPF